VFALLNAVLLKTSPLSSFSILSSILAVATAASVTPALRILRLDRATTLRQE
jgi:ABC-type lipoprotein release transport system permease subunit